MPSPFRMKAASFAQLEVQFTRSAAVVPLPEGSIIEFGIKPKNQTDTDPLVYCNTFSATAGTLYSATLNLATSPLAAALGIGDSDATDDKKSPVEFSGEVGWSINGELFRSQTFSVFIEAPVISGGSPTLFNPIFYPALDGNVLHFVRGDGTLGTASGGGGVGLTTLTTYSGNIGTSGTPAGNIYGTFFGDGSNLTNIPTGDLVNATFNGIALSTFVNASDGTVNNALTAGYAATAGASQFDFNTFFGIGWGAQDIGTLNNPYGTVYALGFVRDGTDLTSGGADVSSWGDPQIDLIGPVFSNPNGLYFDSIGAALTARTANNAPNNFFNGYQNGEDFGTSGAPLGTIYAGSFVGDGSYLTNVGSGSTDLPNYTGDIGNSGTSAGNIYGTFHGDGSSMVAGYAYTSGGAAVAQVAFNDFFSSITNYGSMDVGQSGGAIQNVYANYFYGDGSGLTNVGSGGSNPSQLFDSSGAVVVLDASAGWPMVLFNGVMTTMPVNDGNNRVVAYDGSTMTIDNADNANTANYASGAGSCGWADVAGSVSSLDLDPYRGNVGNSDDWCANVFADNIEAGTIHADEYFVCYTGMSLPSPAPTGTICYSRHAGGHFYGMVEGEWKQLDN